MPLRWQVATFFLVAFGIAASHANADVPYTILHTFDSKEGSYLGGPLVISGNYAYGTAQAGGSQDNGTLYRLDLTTGQLSVLYTFGNPATAPTDPQYMILSGSNLYGIAEDGGAGSNGAIYRYDLTSNSMTTLYSFPGNYSKGAFPVQTSLTQSGSVLYGVAHYGGSASHGVVFKLDTSNNNAYSVLHNFVGNEGADPMCKLALAGNFLYGTAQDGGTANLGTLYKVDITTGALSVLHTFTGGTADGTFPWGNSVLVSGNRLLGMTDRGGAFDQGVLYSYDLSSDQFTVLHSFAGGTNDGAQPFNADLLQEGNLLYGVTSFGGSANVGTVFQFDLNTNQLSILHSFTGPNDSDPRTTLVRSGDYLYGVTNAAQTDGAGVIFSLYVPLAVGAPEPASIALIGVAAPLLLARRRGSSR